MDSAGKTATVRFPLANPPASVFSYLADQEIHHRRMTFQEEFRALLNKHEIRFDERYVWDCPRQILRPFSIFDPRNGCFSRGNISLGVHASSFSVKKRQVTRRLWQVVRLSSGV